MGLPKFPELDSIPSREEAINAILTSIAMEETALSHILTAESEKIKHVINRAKENPGCNLCSVLKVNKSVADMLDRVNDMQILLKSKLRIASQFLPNVDPPCPPDPPDPPDPPVPPKPCTSMFVVQEGYCWSKGTNLGFKMHKQCNNGVRLGMVKCNKVILLPPGKKFKLALDVRMHNAAVCPITVELLLGSGDNIVDTKKYHHNGDTRHFNIKDTLVWETPGAGQQNYVALRLLEPARVKVLYGEMLITELI